MNAPRILAIALAIPAWLLIGCQQGPPPPETHPVKGKVLTAQGEPVPRAEVRFVSVTDPNLIVTGSTGEDGSFVLATVHEQSKIAGAVVGEYKVTIIPSMPDQTSQQAAAYLPVEFVDTFKVAEGDNDFTINLP